MPLYAVGGLPRDLWLSRPATDLDLVVQGDAIELAQALALKHGGLVTPHARFGTAKWDLRGTELTGVGGGDDDNVLDHRGHFLDLVTARRETYRHPGALPTVTPGTIEDDVARRDFTINSLGVRLDGPHFGEVVDRFGALDDLQAGLIKVLHARSFLDDPTRIFRAVRYESRFSFVIAPETIELVPGARRLVADLSGHRIRHELDLILEERDAATMLPRLEALHVLEHVHPALPRTKLAVHRVSLANAELDGVRRIGARSELGWILWLLDVPEAEIRSLSKRLRMTRSSRANISSAARLKRSADALPSWPASKSAAHLDAYPEISVYAVSLQAQGKLRRVLTDYLTVWKHMRARASGHDLKQLGLPPGPAYGRILRSLRNAWIDGNITDAAGERQMLLALARRSLGASNRPHRQRAASSAPHGGGRRAY